MSMTYEEMVDGCRRRNAKAQRALYDELAPMAAGVCRRYSTDCDEAHDMLQDGFVKIYERIGSLRDPQKLRSWVYNIMVNTCIQHYRRARYTVLMEMDSDIAEREADLPYSMEDIVRALDTLTPMQRMAFNLCYAEEYSYEEAAKQMGCSKGAVKVCLCRARRLLREFLEQESEKVKDN